MVIDEEIKHVLTRISKTKKGVKKTESDHNLITAEFNCKFTMKDENVKEEIYNLKNKECQAKFKEYTTTTKMLSPVFDSDEDLETLVTRFLKKLKGCVAMCLKKSKDK